MDIRKVGEQIYSLRKLKNITQNELGERVGVSFQAVSKWERGESLPDITILPDLANILETSIDNILLGGEKQVNFKGKIMVSDIKKGLDCLKNMGKYLGKDNVIYRLAVNGINNSMNTDIEKAFTDDYIFDAFLAEAIIQNITQGMYVDISDVKNNLNDKHFVNVVLSYCDKYGIK